jgi:hypothetical protein
MAVPLHCIDLFLHHPFFLVSGYCRFREQMKSQRAVLCLTSELQIVAKSIKQAHTLWVKLCLTEFQFL